jgi:hypothetical protein
LLPPALLAACGAEPQPEASGAAPAKKRALRGTALGAGRFVAPEKTTYILAFVDLDAPETRMHYFETGFFGHGMLPRPLEPHKALLFEKKGPGACEVDLRAGEVLRPITTVPNREFYGHGVFSRDATLLYCTESDLDDHFRGVVNVRDAHSMDVLGEFPTYGLAPHDCLLSEDGSTLVITNAGGDVGGEQAPCVAYVDVRTEQLIEKLEFDSGLISAGHLALTPRGDLVCISAPRDGLPNKIQQPGGVSLRPFGGAWRTMTEPAEVTRRMVGETLSVAVHPESRTVAATTPEADLVTFWHLDRGELLGKLDVPYPRGVALTLDGSEFVVSYDRTESKLLRLDARTLEVDTSWKRENIGIGGSHLLTYDVPA